MTEPDFDQALTNLREAFGEPTYKMVRNKCPRCRRWRTVSAYLLTVPCVACRPIGEDFGWWDLLLMLEFRLSWKAYQVKLERDGAPWFAPRKWVHSLQRQKDWNRAHGTGRPRDTDA